LHGGFEKLNEVRADQGNCKKEANEEEAAANCNDVNESGSMIGM